MEIPVTICFKIILWIISPISGILAMHAALGCVLQKKLMNRGILTVVYVFLLHVIIIIFMVDVIFIYPLGYCDINQKMFY